MKQKNDGNVEQGVAVCKKCRMQIKFSGGKSNLNSYYYMFLIEIEWWFFFFRKILSGNGKI